MDGMIVRKRVTFDVFSLVGPGLLYTYLDKQTWRRSSVQRVRRRRGCFVIKRCPFWEFPLSSFMQGDSAFQRLPSRYIEWPFFEQRKAKAASFHRAKHFIFGFFVSRQQRPILVQEQGI